MKPPPLYQGRDWFSEYGSVATTYEALNKIEDLCQSRVKNKQSNFLKDHSPLLSLLMDYSDMLQKGILHMTCELIPTRQYVHTIKQGWVVFEIQHLVKTLKEQLTDLSETERKETLFKIISLSGSLKDRIRQLDQ